MPVPLTYPGVYIQEASSGVRTITGVATSITAFVGRALRGTTDEPVVVNSWSDYERQFGGLWTLSPLSFAVRDFFRNGGGQAIVVRAYRGDDINDPKAKKDAARLSSGGLALVAASPGEWGNKLRMRIDDQTATGDSHMFNLSIRDGGTGAIEVFRNVSIDDDHARNVGKVLKNESALVRVATAPNAPLTPHDKGTGKDVWDATNNPATSTGVATQDEASNGRPLTVDQITGDSDKGLYALGHAELFNLLCLPGWSDTGVIGDAAVFCEQRRAFLLVDPPWTTKAAAVTAAADFGANLGTKSRNAAVFFPRLRQPNPLHDNQIEEFPPCGAVAGIFARTDAQRGVWKAAAGLEATLVGVPALEVPLTDAENGELNPLGVNCLRTMPSAGRVIWGARTLDGADKLASEWKYIPVRRTALFLEESLFRGTQWVVFEPNAEPLWAQIRLNVGAFMHDLFRQGAFAGTTPRDAYFVKCDKETTTQSDVNKGVVNIVVGFAPLKPAEFVVITLQQMAGQISV